jgi:predicted TIM-barrel fold metal-dependent hydrolase
MTYVANSGDSHVLEPPDLWQRELPASMRERGIRTERPEGGLETVYIGDRLIRREVPGFDELIRPPGARDPRARLADLDDQGVWYEVIYPSSGLWISFADDPDLEMAHARVYNDWVHDTFMSVSERLLGIAVVPVRDAQQAVAEASRAKELGFRGVMLPMSPPDNLRYNNEHYEPVWAAMAEMDMPVTFHVGSGTNPIVERRAGGAIINYTESFLPAQRTLTYLVASGVLDRHPNLRLIFAEGGASWLAGVMERIDEAYRQHHDHVRPKLTTPPIESVQRQVHVTFQHDRAALFTTHITGLEALIWGSDYPHLEGTFPNTRKAIEDVFDGVPDDVRKAATFDNLARVFKTPPPPTA